MFFYFFFFNDTATTEIYTLSLHDALPISRSSVRSRRGGSPASSPEKPCGPRQRRSLSVRGRRCPRTSSRIDRKSTRLNSSHSQISYAVFCLKKKKNEEAVHLLDTQTIDSL